MVPCGAADCRLSDTRRRPCATSLAPGFNWSRQPANSTSLLGARASHSFTVALAARKSPHNQMPRAQSPSPAPLPRAILLDLDDTILDDSGRVDACWREACSEHASPDGGIDAHTLLAAIHKTSKWYWSD